MRDSCIHGLATDLLPCLHAPCTHDLATEQPLRLKEPVAAMVRCCCCIRVLPRFCCVRGRELRRCLPDKVLQQPL